MKIGDKVYFGPYGEFEDARIFIIRDINEDDPVFNNTTYLLHLMGGDSTVLALKHEVLPV